MTAMAARSRNPLSEVVSMESSRSHICPASRIGVIPTWRLNFGSYMQGPDGTQFQAAFLARGKN
jgi:hypothetical protein